MGRCRTAVGSGCSRSSAGWQMEGTERNVKHPVSFNYRRRRPIATNWRLGGLVLVRCNSCRCALWCVSQKALLPRVGETCFGGSKTRGRSLILDQRRAGAADAKAASTSRSETEWPASVRHDAIFDASGRSGRLPGLGRSPMQLSSADCGTLSWVAILPRSGPGCPCCAVAIVPNNERLPRQMTER